MVRPKKDIDLDQVKRLAIINCTYDEIAAVIDCSVDTLSRRFADVIKKCREQGKMSLRRMQFDAANKGNTTMLIWLGKQYLGQTDKQELLLERVPDDRLIEEAKRRIEYIEGSKEDTP